MKKTQRIILDCDPGHDDAIAIILAAAKNNPLEIEAITTVSGNVGIEKTTLNALKIVDLLGLDVPVAKGSERPMVRRMETAGEIHGDTGMDGPDLPENPKASIIDQHAVDLIIEKVLAYPNEMILVPTGPLTNIAMAMVKEPKIIPMIKEVVIMGGGTFGNWTPTAEFNIFVDAEAARIVFESGAPIALFGLDVTHQAVATDEVVATINDIDNHVANFVSDLLEFFGQSYEDYFNFDGPPIHDACTVAYLIDPTLFTFEKVHVDVETSGEFTYGTTSVDLLHKTEGNPQVNFATQLDKPAFWEMVMETLKTY